METPTNESGKRIFAGREFEEAMELLKSGDVGSGFYKTPHGRNEIYEIVLAVTAPGKIQIFRPNLENASYAAARTLAYRYKKIEPDEAKPHWNKVLELSRTMCSHVMWYNKCADANDCNFWRIDEKMDMDAKEDVASDEDIDEDDNISVAQPYSSDSDDDPLY